MFVELLTPLDVNQTSGCSRLRAGGARCVMLPNRERDALPRSGNPGAAIRQGKVHRGRRGDSSSLGQEHGALHDVLQFAHVSGGRPLWRRFIWAFRREPRHALSYCAPGATLLPEPVREERDVSRRSRSGGQLDVEHVEPVVESSRKVPSPSAFLMSRFVASDDAHVHADCFLLARRGSRRSAARAELHWSCKGISRISSRKRVAPDPRPP